MDELVTYTVYFSPQDYPRKWVLRKWFIRRGSETPIADKEVVVRDNYDELFQYIPPGLYKIPADDQDFQSTIETWL